MIETLKIEKFKAFEEFSLEFGKINLLVGGNNAGKTTIFHALQLFSWCLDRTASSASGPVTLRKTQVGDVPAIPNAEVQDLFFNQKTRTGRGPTRMRITVSSEKVKDVTFEIYSAFANNWMVSGEDRALSAAEYEELKSLKPLFIPGMVGVTVREDLIRPIAQERMIREGNQSQILRNIIYEVQKKGRWNAYLELVGPIFGIEDLRIPFDPEKDEWLTVEYGESGNFFDLVSAGSGFLQLLNLLGFIFLHEPKIALIDEPDSHMHDDLQRLTFDVLRRLSESQGTQFIITTHSSTLMDEAGLDCVLLIDRNESQPLNLRDEKKVAAAFGERGIDFVPSKVVEALRTKRALFVEGKDSDYKDFLAILGEKHHPGFRQLAQRLTIFQTEGLTSKWPFDAIAAFERLLGVELNYAYLSDRDFLRPEEISDREESANISCRRLFHTNRRNRESYLLEPEVLHRLLKRRWDGRHGSGSLPQILTPDGIKKWFVEYAKQHANKARTALLAENESYVRDDRPTKTLELNELFEVEYTARVENETIPLSLMDSKAAISEFRRKISDQYGIHFNDREVFEEFLPDEVPEDISAVVARVVSMFQHDGPGAQKEDDQTDATPDGGEGSTVQAESKQDSSTDGDEGVSPLDGQGALF